MRRYPEAVKNSLNYRAMKGKVVKRRSQRLMRPNDECASQRPSRGFFHILCMDNRSLPVVARIQPVRLLLRNGITGNEPLRCGMNGCWVLRSFRPTRFPKSKSLEQLTRGRLCSLKMCITGRFLALMARKRYPLHERISYQR